MTLIEAKLWLSSGLVSAIEHAISRIALRVFKLLQRSLPYRAARINRERLSRHKEAGGLKRHSLVNEPTKQHPGTRLRGEPRLVHKSVASPG
jgi:hypothetical protein